MQALVGGRGGLKLASEMRDAPLERLTLRLSQPGVGTIFALSPGLRSRQRVSCAPEGVALRP
eukprot:scaffold86583_cov26-Tisochrysis_lutea.AAC.2